jgi:hypothetical protein
MKVKQLYSQGGDKTDEYGFRRRIEIILDKEPTFIEWVALLQYNEDYDSEKPKESSTDNGEFMLNLIKQIFTKVELIRIATDRIADNVLDKDSALIKKE